MTDNILIDTANFASFAFGAVDDIALTLDRERIVPYAYSVSGTGGILGTSRNIFSEFGAGLRALGRGKIDDIVSIQGGNRARWIVNNEGQPISVSGRITEDFGGQAAGNVRSLLEDSQSLLTGKLGFPSDQGGHLAAHRFFKDQGLKNLFPQNSNFNQGSFKVLENDYARALKVPGTEISFSHKLDSFDDINRPNLLRVDTKIYRNGELFDRIRFDFTNSAGKQYTRRY